MAVGIKTGLLDPEVQIFLKKRSTRGKNGAERINLRSKRDEKRIGEVRENHSGEGKYMDFEIINPK